MLNVLLVNDPFDPFFRSAERHAVSARSIRGAAKELFGADFVEFEYPTLALVDGEPYMRSQWDEVLEDFSRVTFVRLAQGVVEWIIAIIIIIVAIVIALVFVTKNNNAAIGAAPNQLQNGAPVYTLTGQSNQNRLNNAIECVYGYNKVFPAIAAASYNIFSGNDQFQFSLYCLGHGSFNVTNLRLENSDIGQFPGAQYQICPPGVVPSLVHADVITSVDVSGIELFATDEDQYSKTPTGYNVCAPGFKVTRIELDISLPSGLYIFDSTGELDKATVKLSFEYCQINDLDQLVGNWSTLTTWSKKDKTVNPHRYTVGIDVASARYRVRGRRTNKKNKGEAADGSADGSGTRVADTVHWEAMRGFIPFTPQFGDVTLIAIKLRATNELNNNVSSRFNCFVQRILRVWNPNTGWHLAPTRSVVWAFCDVFQAKYGARLPDNFLDLQDLYALDQKLSAQGKTFDYIFDQRSTVWEAATAIAGAARGVPMLTGSQLSIVIDAPQNTATAVFNVNNIVAGSLTWSVKLPTVADNDGLQVEYVDKDTWAAETVDCLVGDDEGNFPEQLKIVGVTDRTRAYRLGMYRRAVKLYQTESIEFKTGMEGHLPQFGDLILIQHDVPLWGVGGKLLSMTNAGEGDDLYTLVVVDNETDFAPDSEDLAKARLILRKRDGSAYGPVGFTFWPDDASNRTLKIPRVNEDFNFNDYQEPPYWLCGLENLECKRAIVVGIAPQEDDVVTLKCAAYDERLYAFDALAAPPLYSLPTKVVVPTHPNVGALTVTQQPDDAHFVVVYWPPTLGAIYYTVETSPDNATWALIGSPDTSSLTFEVDTTDVFYIRVTAHGSAGAGTPRVWSGAIGLDVLPGVITGLNVTYNVSGTIAFQWDALPGITNYDVLIIAKDNGLIVRSDTAFVFSGPGYYSYSLYQGAIDGLTSRGIIFKVRAHNASGVGPYAEVGALIAPLPSSVVTIPPHGTCDMSYADLVLFAPFTCDNNTRTCDSN